MFEKEPYFPPVWEDDLQMSGLMSMNKAREVNPVDFDRKIRFWSELISASCMFKKDPVVSLEQLKKRFRRGDQVPGCLDDTINHMINKEECDLVELSKYKGRDWTWSRWGFSRIVQSIWGGDDGKNIQYVHLSTIRFLANQVFNYFRHDFNNGEEETIIGYIEFRECCSNLVANDDVFEIIVLDLVRREQLAIGTSKSGERILKFRDRDHEGPMKWTESDASLHDLRTAMNKLEREMKRLEDKAKIAEEKARAFIRSGDRNQATNYLRQKKRALIEVEAKDGQYHKLLEMLHQLGQARQDRKIIDAFKAGAAAFKSAFTGEGIGIEKVGEAMDSVHDALATAEEIQDVISSLSPSSGAFDKELEDELNSILSEKGTVSPNSSILKSLPEVPSDLPESEDTEDEFVSQTLARRLKKLSDPL